jgi:Putative zinc-finger
MRDQHVTDMLEAAPLAQLGESELAAVRTHAAGCDDCRRAYEAARVSSLLLRERAAETFEPSPFFQTRVLAALRERRAGVEAPAFKRLWRSAGALVSSMAATVALLATLTFLNPAQLPDAAGQDTASASNPYEEVVVAQDELTAGEMTYGQVLTTIYELEDDAR